MEIKPGAIIEFFESKRLLCAVCLEVKNSRLLVLTEQDRETNVSVKRILHIDHGLVDIKMSRIQLVAILQEAAARRQNLMGRISVEELWDLLHEEEEGFSCNDLAEICFSEEIASDHTSAVLRALLTDSIHFKLKGRLFYANSREKIKQILLQHERQAQKEKELAEGSHWLGAVWRGEPVAKPENRGRYLRLLKDFCLFGTEASDYQQIKKILAMAQVPVPQGIFPLLVKLGVWNEDENLYLHRFGIQEDFPVQVLEAADQIAEDLGSDGGEWRDDTREDLISLPTFTID
jgi:exoribonuclease-2